VLMENRPEFFEVCWAAQRSGLFYTCINWHFNGDEAAYIIDDCDAQVLVVSDAFSAVAIELLDKMPNAKVRLVVGDHAVDGYDAYEMARDRYPAEPLAEELEGSRMLYSSGTTGRPKGVKYKIARQRVGEQPAEMGMMTTVWRMGPDTVYLSPAPLYHSAPLFYCMSTLRLGGTAIMVGMTRAEAQITLPTFDLFFNEKTLKGSKYGSGQVRRDFQRFIDLIETGRLDTSTMVSRTIKLDDVNDAFRAMEAGEVIRSVITSF